jgi:hypothetical protein
MWTRGVVIALAATILIVGCAKQEQARNKEAPGKQADPKKESKHATWWCDEHGVPEAECSMCDAKAAKAFKAKGDWCKEHDRAKSQCFICEPVLREKYAALYKAKYGKEPPPPEDNMPRKADKN